MTANLSYRVGALLLAGFLLLQLGTIALMAIPGRGGEQGSYGLPSAPALAQLVRAMDNAGPEGARALATSYSDSLFTVELARKAPDHFESIPESMSGLAAAYRATLDDHNVVVDGGPSWFARWRGVGQAERLVRLVMPIRVTVWLRDGQVLVVTGQPSRGMRHYLTQRSMVALAGGLALLLLMVVAVRKTTQPLVRLADHVRAIGDNLDAPDVRLDGGREVQALAQAFNQMKQRILQLVGERTMILAGIAHDMRTFLTRLRLRAEFIDDPNQQARALADLEAMISLLDDSLLFSRLGTRHDVVALQRIDLAEETRQLAGELDPEEAARVSPVLPDRPLWVQADRSAVARIFNNLVQNGLRHAPSVRVTVGPGGSWQFDDDGPGVPEEELGTLGQPFRRLDESRDRRSGGTGLGLAIVTGLVQAMGGKTRFSRSELGGLCIHLTLPGSSH